MAKSFRRYIYMLFSVHLKCKVGQTEKTIPTVGTKPVPPLQVCLLVRLPRGLRAPFRHQLVGQAGPGGGQPAPPEPRPLRVGGRDRPCGLRQLFHGRRLHHSDGYPAAATAAEHQQQPVAVASPGS
jgi:hypothetical protein